MGAKALLHLTPTNPAAVRLTLERSVTNPGGVFVKVDTLHHAGAQLTREDTLALYEALGDHLAATALDAEPAVPQDQCGRACAHDHLHSLDCPDTEPPTILEEAQAAVYGPRQGDYGHPREDFTRQAILYTGLLQHKLAEGAYIDADDIPRLMIATKLARDVHQAKRDNRVDMAGYALTLDRLETGR